MASSRSSAATEAGGGGAIAYGRSGTGPPLLLIHGLGATRRIWEPQHDRLAAERDVIAVDMPGFGESPSLAAAPTPAALAAALAALCDDLGIERPHVAGNSLGGWVALELAKAGRAASLCLISPAGLWSRPLGPRRVDSRAWARRLRPLVGPLVRSRRARAAMLRSTLARPDLISADDAEALIAAWIDAPAYDAANAEMRRGVCTDLDRVTVPTTIAWGEHDGLVAPPKPERRPPGSRLIVLEGCGHTPNWDAPERIAELLLDASGSDPV